MLLMDIVWWEQTKYLHTLFDSLKSLCIVLFVYYCYSRRKKKKLTSKLDNDTKNEKIALKFCHIFGVPRVLESCDTSDDCMHLTSNTSAAVHRSSIIIDIINAIFGIN
eukprot:921214_1